jgi:hypothetical protein
MKSARRSAFRKSRLRFGDWLADWFAPARQAKRSVPFRRHRLEVLEHRTLLSASPLSMSFDPTQGLLAIQGDGHDHTVQVSLGASGGATIVVDNVAYASDPGSASFNPSLAGLTAASLTHIEFSGSGQDSLTLTDVQVGHGLTVQVDGDVRLAGNVAAAGSLDIDANLIEVAGAVRAASVSLDSTGLTVVDSGGSLRTDGSAGGQIVVHAANVLQAGTVAADGSLGAGRVEIDYTGSYIDTASALTSASGGSGAGGLVLISGGSTGHLFSSGRQAATGSLGGTVDLLGRNLVLVGNSVDVSGQDGGGAIHVGGGYHGANADLVDAATVQVSPSTVLRADALVEGTGGQVTVWAD